MSFPDKNQKCDYVLTMYNVYGSPDAVEKLISSLAVVADYICRPQKFTVEDNPRSKFYNAKFDESMLHEGLEKFDLATGFARFNSSEQFEYELHFSAIKEDSGTVDFRLNGVEYVMAAELYGMSTEMVMLWKPDYAYAAPYWAQYERNEEYGRMMREKNFRKYGPDSFSIRTWLSWSLAEMIDISELSRLGADVKELSGYGYQVDLLPEPWKADFDVLLEQREKLNAVLSEAGIKGDYTKPYLPLSGPIWGEFLSRNTKVLPRE